MFIIYGKDTCPYCWKARKLLDDYGHKYLYEEVTHAKDTSIYWQYKKNLESSYCTFNQRSSWWLLRWLYRT